MADSFLPIGIAAGAVAFAAADRAVARAHAAYLLADMAHGEDAPETAAAWARFVRMVEIWKAEGGMDAAAALPPSDLGGENF